MAVTVKHVYNGPFHRQKLMNSRNYAAHPGFLKRVEWRKTSSGVFLIESKLPNEPGDKPLARAYCTVVGEVSDMGLSVGPSGNFKPQYNSSATKAKYSFQLSEPNDADFNKDYKLALDQLYEIQKKYAVNTDMRHFVTQEGTIREMRFASAILEPRDVAIECVDGNYDDAELDDVTRGWPVPTAFTDAFKQCYPSHQINPLRVLGQDGKRLAASKVPDALKGALVEVTFSLKHIRFWRPESFNSYNAAPEQILILRPALPKLANPYKENINPSPSRGEQINAARFFLPPTPYTQDHNNSDQNQSSTHTQGALRQFGADLTNRLVEKKDSTDVAEKRCSAESSRDTLAVEPNSSSTPGEKKRTRSQTLLEAAQEHSAPQDLVGVSSAADIPVSSSPISSIGSTSGSSDDGKEAYETHQEELSAPPAKKKKN